MQTLEKQSHVRPALSHSLLVVYDRGEAPGYDVSYDSRLAHPARTPRGQGQDEGFMGSSPVGMDVAIPEPRQRMFAQPSILSCGHP
jgi:hypothetical protein